MSPSNTSTVGRHHPTGWLLLGCLLLSGIPHAADVVLPESLGGWYKPQNERQVWLHTMFSLRRELQAVREYATQSDRNRVLKWAGKMAGHYPRLPEMVPEWRDEVDTGLVDDLLASAEAGDHAAVTRAADRLERDCRSCHRQYQALAALRFRWPRFDTLQVADGDGGQRPYDEHMELLSGTLNRIRIAADDDGWDVAHSALAALRDQLHALGEGCNGCHDDPSPRERVLGSETSATLDRLQQALADSDKRSAGRWLGSAAVQTCARCHGIHRILSEVRQRLFD